MAKVYCFGNTENGELGLGGIEEEHILTPRKQRLPYDRRKYTLIQVTSGRNHTLFLLNSISHDCNIVFSCGSNERLQLGRVGSWKRLEEVNSLSQHNISKLACGFNNSLALSEAGQLFSWGCNLFGQLGLGQNEQEVGKPSLIKKLAVKNIVQISCGGNHCLALTKNGEVYAWGSNAFGQLGLGTSGNCVNSPVIITSLQWTPVRQIAAGGSHSSVLTFTGAIYLWGKNEFGQLGLNDKTNRKLPTLQRSLRNQKIAYIDLGEEHSAALTNVGGLFTWGAGMYGQLGHGRNSNEILPRKVFELMGIAITQVSCGRCHTLVVTKRGRTYSFGLNGSGQLGIGSTKVMYVPSDVSGPWIEIDVKEVLLRDGERSLYPSYQLQNSELSEPEVANSASSSKNFNEDSIMKSPESKANVSMEIDEVTDENFFSGENNEQCFIEEPDDDKSTAARFVCVENTVYPNETRTVEIDEYESDPDSDVEEQSQRTQYVVREVVASKGDQSFVLIQPYCENVAPRDFRQALLSQEILKFDNTVFEQFKDVSKESIPLDIVDYIEEVFSSIPSWNASYLKLDASSDSSEVNNSKMLKFTQLSDDLCNTDDGQIEWNDAFHGFNMIEDADNERINELIYQSVSKILANLPDLSYKDFKNLRSSSEALDSEVLRVFQMLPLFHLFRMNSYSPVSQQLITAFSVALLSFTEPAKKCLTLWWAQMPRRYFKNLILIIRKSIELNLLEQHKSNKSNESQSSEVRLPKVKQQDVHQNLAYCLEVLKMLYQTNKMVEKVSYKEFYIDGISDMFDLKVDYFLWKNHRQGSSSTKEYFLCDYPFIFDVPAKNLILSTDSEIQQQSAAQTSVYQQLLLTSIHPAGTVVLNPYLIISVHRNTILQETINQLCLFSKHNEADFKKPLRVYFEGEEAIDAGQGMKKEFFLLLMKEILDAKYGMFMEYKETSTIWFHHSNDEDEVMYNLIGILCGIAIYNKVIIYLPFPLILYKKILNETLELDDLSHLDPMLTKNLKEILMPTYAKDEFDAIFGDLTFVITLKTFGSPVDFELCPNGKNRKLTYENREEYVQLYWEYILQTSIQKQFASFLRGFMKVLDTDILKIFHAEELMQLVSGQEVIDWEELENITEYKLPFNKNHPTIRLFWKVFYSFTNEEKKKLLLFLTGSDRIPILGVKALNLVIQPMKVSEDHLPVAHTCFNILDLPQDYQSEDREEKLRSKLLKACEYTHGFALV